MRALFYNVNVIRDANFHIPRLVSAWELPILQEIYGEGSIEVQAEEQRDIPDIDVASEKARLERHYKVEEDSKIPFVEVVYGRGPAGIKALEKAIKASEIEEKRKPKPADA
jgi:hypothetical protein